MSVLYLFFFRPDYYLPSVGESHLTSLGGSNDTGLRDKRVGKSGLSVVDVRDDGHVSNVGGLVCSAISSATTVQSCDDDFSRISQAFRSLFTQTNGKLLTHKRTDFVDGEARALLVLIPRRKMYDRCHKTPGGKERQIGNQILSKPSRSTCCSFPPLPVHLQAFSLPPMGFAHPYLPVQERLT